MKDLVVVRDQLISCCEEELSEDLENLYGSELDNKTEEQLLAMMRQLAVVAQNHLVNIMRLRALVQDSDESVRSYLARLKGSASVCKLTVMCTCDPSTSALWAKFGDQVVVSLKTQNYKIYFILLFSETLETNNEPS